MVLTTQTGCAWTATSNVPGISNVNFGIGTKNVNYTVAPNTVLRVRERLPSQARPSLLMKRLERLLLLPIWIV